jgi:peptidoglycan pentaglycine glycine transferase (the first glycine)
MEAIHVNANRREEWNAFVLREPSFALLQSWEWGEFKEKLGWKVIRTAVEQQGRIVAGAQILIKPAPLGLFSIAYVPRGPVGKWLDEETAPCLLDELHQVARCKRAIFLKIEPPLLYDPKIHRKLERYGFRASGYTNQPCATIIVDLTQDLDDILAQMHHKTRYNIRYAARKKVVVRMGGREDLVTFDHLMQRTGRRAGFIPRKLVYFEHEWETLDQAEQIRMLVATYLDEILAINVSVAFGEHAAYFHGASSGKHKRLMPNQLLMWEAIKWAKSRNCRTFDLWGIPDAVGVAAFKGDDLPMPDRTDDLWGVYRFKRGYSHNIVLYTGAHDYVYSPLLYAFVSNKFLSAKRLDRIAVWLDSKRHRSGCW